MGRTDDVAQNPLSCMGKHTQLEEHVVFDNGVDILPLPDDVPDGIGILDITLCGGALIKCSL